MADLSPFVLAGVCLNQVLAPRLRPKRPKIHYLHAAVVGSFRAPEVVVTPYCSTGKLLTMDQKLVTCKHCRRMLED